MSARLPATVCGYRLETLLSEHAEGRVYLARDARGRRVAFKLHERGAGDGAARAELAVLGLAHPGLASCLDANRWPGDGRVFTVSEYVRGTALGPAALADEAATRARHLDLAARLLGVVAFLHDRGLLHRDIKEENMLLAADTGAPVLLDFGLCCPIAEAAARPLAGTPRALAPELLRGSSATVASDLWSTGLVLAEALCRRRLFGAGDTETMLAERRAYAGLRADDVARVGDGALAALLDRLLAPEPGDRPADAQAALAALPPDGTERARAALHHAALTGALSAAVAGVDPARAARLAALDAGAVWVELFPGAATSLPEALGHLAALARSVGAPSPRLAARLTAATGEHARLRPEDIAGLVEALAECGPLVVSLGTPQAADAPDRALREELARQLGSLPRVEVFTAPGPTPHEAATVVAAWIGARPPLVQRLAAALPPTFDELASALGALVRAGAVSLGPAGVTVREERVPAEWPAASAGEIDALVQAADRELLALLAVSPRPLAASVCRAVLGREVRAALGDLVARGLLERVPSHPEALYAPGDGRVQRLLAARLPLDARARAALAHHLVPPDGELDAAGAADVAAVFGDVAPEGPDDEATGALLARAANELRRAGRLGRAAALLRRGAAGAAAGTPAARRLWLDLADVLVRAGAWDEALAAIAEARARLPGEPALDVREARVALLRNHADEALAQLGGLDVDALPDEDALLALQTRLDALHVLSRYEEALGVLREALRRLGGAPHIRAMSLLERAGLIEERLGRYDEAVRHYEAAIAMAPRIGQQVLVGSPMYYMGRAIRTRGERRRGFALQEQGARLMEEAGQQRGLLTALNGLGVAALALGRLDTARRHLARALSLARRLGDPREEAIILNNTGRVLFAEGRGDEAEEAFAASLALRERLDDRRGRAIVALTRGPLRLAQGRVQEARDDLALALELLAGLTAPTWRLEADLFAAQLALSEGDRDAVVAAAGRARDAAAGHGLRTELLLARDLLCRAGADAVDDVDAEAEERGAALADLLFSRGVWREQHGRHELADQDFALAFAILGETPDGPIEARGLVARTRVDLDRLERALGESSGGDGEALRDYRAIGKLLSRVARDVERARTLVAIHGLGPLQRQLESQVERLGAVEHRGLDVSGLGRLAERVNTLERLTEINKLLNSERDTQRLLELIVDSAIELTGAARGFLILFDGRSEEFRAARNIDESTITDPQFQVSHSVARQVMQSRQPLLTANALDDPRLASASSISELKLLSILCVPLVVRDRSLGSIYLDHPQVVGRFQEQHLATALSLAEQAAIALENARLSEGLSRTNTELVASQGEIARLNAALQSQLALREAELEEVRESLEASRKALGLKYDYSRIITRSPRMNEVLDLMDRVIDTDVPVIIQGESGTGKELIASAIHFNGRRAARNFVSINCAAIPEPLIESELFGSVRGAFTGADADRKGLFEQAHEGTLFLDEIGDMTLDVQKRLLRVLQEGEFLPVGGREVRSVDVRILCATHRDLRQMVGEGSFREDLYYRLAVAQVRLPPLKERTEDIALLLPHFLELHGGAARSIDPEALALLERHPWPGNVRELGNFAMNLLLHDREGTRVTARLVRRVLGLGPEAGEADGEEETGAGATLRERLESFERQQVLTALERSGGNKAAAARELGVGVRTFYKILARLGL